MIYIKSNANPICDAWHGKISILSKIKLNMSKYCGPRFRIIRRLGKLIAFSKKEQLKHTTRPGQHGANRVKLTQFAYRLIEKQNK